jgi:signal transduction histidine kinase
MRAWPFTAVPSGKALIKQFGVLSFVVIGLICVALSVVLSTYLRNDLLEREWLITADFVRTQVLSTLTPGDLAAPRSKAAQEHFQALYQQTVKMPELFRVKVYDAGTAVVWSDEPHLIGQRFADNPHLGRAMSGRTVVNLESAGGKPEKVTERNIFAQVVEVYVPIVFPGASRVAGVVEVSKMPQQVLASIRRGQLTVVGTVLGCGLLLYLSLYWIVRRAARRIEEQHQALEQRSRDLSAANLELTAVQRQLLEAERMAAIGEVVTAVAHGIRNPLANIRASAQVAGLDLPQAAPASQAAKHLTHIMAEVDRLESRLRELLQFVGPAQRQAESVDLNQILAQSLEMVAGRIGKDRIQLIRELEADLPPVAGNRMLIEQVFLSLLGNALEALPASGGKITVRTGRVVPDASSAGIQVFAEVQDTGVGMSGGQLGKIFQPFYTTKAQGTGLGLAIAKKFTETLGGSISAWSVPGEGTRFRVVYPGLAPGREEG